METTFTVIQKGKQIARQSHPRIRFSRTSSAINAEGAELMGPVKFLRYLISQDGTMMLIQPRDDGEDAYAVCHPRSAATMVAGYPRELKDRLAGKSFPITKTDDGYLIKIEGERE